MKKLIFFVPVLLLSINSLAQNISVKSSKSGRPDLPGTFLLELGVNNPVNSSASFNTGFWGSRTVNLYYQYDIRILKSRFSLVPGIGLGMDRYKFTNNYTLDYESGTNAVILTKSELSVKKSQLITNYLDVPVEVRYTSNPENPNRSLKLAFGFRGGMLISSFSKLKYTEDSETIKLKTRRNWNLNKFRYGVYGKIGTGNFSVFGYYNLSTLFKTGMGPDDYDINNVTFGISLGGF